MVRKYQKGASLLIALLFAGALTGVLTGITIFTQNQVKLREAKVAAEEIIQVSRAARVFARNFHTSRPNLVSELSLIGTGPEEYSVQDLIDEALLPTSFGRVNGNDYFNSLGQKIRIFVANYPVDGDPSLSSTVPTAYVLFEDSQKSKPQIQQNVISNIRSKNISLSFPIFSNGVNVTGVCREVTNGNTVSLWDTGCLGENDYDLIIDGLDNDDIFTSGMFLIPTWKVQVFDNRAIMRFPQPEQVGSQTMLTDLEMANMKDCSPDASGNLTQNQVTLPTETGSENSLLCSAEDDDSGLLIDNRRSISNVADINTNYYIADIQSSGTPDVSRDISGALIIETDDGSAIDIGGNLNIEGDAYIYNGAVNATTINVDRNIYNTGRVGDANLASTDIGGNLETEFSNSTSVSTSNGAATSNINSLNISGSASNINQFISNNQIVTSTINNRNSAVLNIQNDLNATNLNVDSLSVNSNNGTLISSGSDSGLGFATAKITTGNLNVGGDMDVINNTTFRSGLNVETLSITNDADSLDATGGASCEGDCPLRPTGYRYQRCVSLVSIGLYNNLEKCLQLYRDGQTP